MKKIFLTVGLFWIILLSSAQDFNCRISIHSNQITGTNRNRFQTLETALREFINDKKWCIYNLRNNERIECALNINITKENGDEMEGTMVVQLQRPVYNASYKTTVLNFQDKDIKFIYTEGMALEYSETSNLSPITSLIAFYLNLFLAVDFDTFSLNGGADYLTKCNNIVQLNSNAKETGWKSFESGQRNRYWIVENLTNGQYSAIHQFLYQYHRLGLDVMTESPDAGRSVIAESLRFLQQVNSQRSNLYIVQIMINSKSEEIIAIFKEGLPSEKTQVINIMKQLDPANASTYDAINQSSQK